MKFDPDVRARLAIARSDSGANNNEIVVRAYHCHSGRLIAENSSCGAMLGSAGRNEGDQTHVP